MAAAAATVHITCGRCRLRSRSSPPLPKTTVFGAETGALGARKALTPTAHASATISRAMIASEGSTGRYNVVTTHRMCFCERLPPTPRARRPNALLRTRPGPVRNARALPAQRGLAWRLSPRSENSASPSLKNDLHFSRPRIRAPGAIRGGATPGDIDWSSVQGCFCKRRCARDRSELCKGSSDSAFITAQSNKAVA